MKLEKEIGGEGFYVGIIKINGMEDVYLQDDDP
jgi:hypothetical protein